MLDSNRPPVDDSPALAATPEVVQALVDHYRKQGAEHGCLDCHCAPPGKASC